MKITYDPSVDVLSIQLRVADPDHGVDLEDGITADVDEAGRVVGIEMLDASERLGVEALATVTMERFPWEPRGTGAA